MSVISDYLNGLSICLKELSQQDIAEVAEMLFQTYQCGVDKANNLAVCKM